MRGAVPGGRIALPRTATARRHRTPPPHATATARRHRTPPPPHATARQVSEVILVGGMTRMPKVQSVVSDFFGKEPFKGEHCVAVVFSHARSHCGHSRVIISFAWTGMIMMVYRFISLCRRQPRRGGGCA